MRNVRVNESSFIRRCEMTELSAKIPKKILFVDDEENILRSLKRLFIDEDFEVFTASSGMEGLDILEDNHDIGIIVSDQRMPEMSGVEFLERSQRVVPDALRMVLTGYADVTAAVDAINRGGALRYIAKPWKDEELVQTIKDAFHRYSLLQENKRLTNVIKEQNREIRKWNKELEFYVQKQTVEIQNNNKELKRLNERLKSNFKHTIHAFSNLLELRTEDAGSHSRNVAEISVKIARQMGLDAKETEAITIAALLHDIGKIGIPDRLLFKGLEDMSSDELNIYKLHPVRGQTAVDAIDDLRDAGRLIRHHHESYNGKGFPDGLKGDAIPLGAQIISAADFADRTIRKCSEDNPVEYVIKKLTDAIGKRFDLRLLKYIEEPVRGLYSRSLPKQHMVELEIQPDDLKEGMVTAKEVKSGTGLLLLGKDMKLNGKSIQILKRYYQIDPPKTGVFVWVNR